jgi:hypothetical protein
MGEEDMSLFANARVKNMFSTLNILIISTQSIQGYEEPTENHSKGGIKDSSRLLA